MNNYKEINYDHTLTKSDLSNNTMIDKAIEVYIIILDNEPHLISSLPTKKLYKETYLYFL